MEDAGKEGCFAQEGAIAFGARVKNLRRERGWTQEELAARMTAVGCPMHQTTIAKIQSWTRPTSVEELFAFASLFGVPVAELVDPGYATDERQRLLRLATDRATLAMEVAKTAQRLRHLQEQYAVADAQYRAATADIGDDVDPREVTMAQHDAEPAEADEWPPELLHTSAESLIYDPESGEYARQTAAAGTEEA